MAAGGEDRDGIRQQQRRRFEGDEEVDMLYLHSDVSSRPSLQCGSLVCVPVPGWVNVFNPSGPDLTKPTYPTPYIDSLFDVFPGYWRMGFGRDEISGRYKIVRMCFNDDREILDVDFGRWRELSPPPYAIGYRRKSTCVDGCIYWVDVVPAYKLLAFDLHTEEWRDISIPPEAIQFQTSCQVANLENRLVLASTYPQYSYWKVKIWGRGEETWSLVYSIRLLPVEEEHLVGYFFPLRFWTRPVVVSEEGSLYIHDRKKRLFKYCPETDEVCRVAEDVRVVCPFVEDLSPLPRLDFVPRIRAYGIGRLDHGSSVGRRFFGGMDLIRPRVLVTTGIVALIGAFCLRPR